MKTKKNMAIAFRMLPRSVRTTFGQRHVWLVGASIFWLLLSGASARAQNDPTLSVTSNGSSVGSGSTLWISATNPPEMPVVNVSLAGDCGYVEVYVSASWTAPGGVATGGGADMDFNCGGSTDIDWSQMGFYEGGEITVNWTLWKYAGANFGGELQQTDKSGSFSFYIYGLGPDPNSLSTWNPMVDSALPCGTPWFVCNLVAWESAATSVSPTGYYHQFTNSGTPVYCECPEGVGLMQLDPAVSDGDFWNWQTNITDGLGVLNGKESGADSSWSNELYQNSVTTGGNPSECSNCTAGTVNPQPTSYDNCTFQYPQGSAHSYADGDWMHAYNSGYYIFWDPPSGATPGFWDIDVNGYVKNVCDTNSL